MCSGGTIAVREPPPPSPLPAYAPPPPACLCPLIFCTSIEFTVGNIDPTKINGSENKLARLVDHLHATQTSFGVFLLTANEMHLMCGEDTAGTDDI